MRLKEIAGYGSALVLLSWATIALADIVVLKHGGQREGKIIGKGAQEIVLQTPDGEVTYFERGEILEIKMGGTGVASFVSAPKTSGTPKDQKRQTQRSEPKRETGTIRPQEPQPVSGSTSAGISRGITEPQSQQRSGTGTVTISFGIAKQKTEQPSGVQPAAVRMSVVPVLGILGTVLGLVGALIILTAAFRNDGVGTGFLCLCIPFYILYYAAARYTSERKAIVLAIYFGGLLLQVVAQILGFNEFLKHIGLL